MVMNDFALKEQGKSLEMLNQTMDNMSAAFSQYSKDIRRWGDMKAETGKFEANLKWGNYVQGLIGDHKLAADMSTDLAVQLAEWLNIWVQRRLPDATSLPPEHVKKRESSLPGVFSVKLTSITEWVRSELRDQQRRGVV